MIRVVNINNHVNSLRDVLHRSVDEHCFNSHEEYRNMLHLPKAYQGSEIDSESDYKNNDNEFEFNRNENKSNDTTPKNLHDSNRNNAPRYHNERYDQSRSAGLDRGPTHRSQKINERKFFDLFWIPHFENMDLILIICNRMIFNFT
jgi:hypothetical protein